MTDIEIPEGFTRWDGRGIPYVRADVILRNGAKGVMWVGLERPDRWRHTDGESSQYDIIAYRIVS